MITLITTKIIGILSLKPSKSYYNLSRMATLIITLLGMCNFIISCKVKEDIVTKEDTNLTSEQQKFADLLAPNIDGTPKSIIVNIGNSTDPYYIPSMFKIEMKLVNAKAGNFEITPWISKKSIEDVINKAKTDVPNKDLYGISIAFVIKRIDGTLFSPTSTETIEDRNTNHPSIPYLAQIPENFTMDLFKNYNPSTTSTKSYILNKDEELQLWIEVKTIGYKFVTYKQSLKPIEVLANGK